MPNSKISQLNSLTNSTVDVADVLPIVDTSGSETKKMTYQNAMRPKDNVFGIVGSSDTSKIAQFEVDGLTTATTRTITIPDANTTMVGTDTTQTLTNKTLTSPQINFGSDARGDIPVRNSSGVTSRLPIGTSGQILSSNASGDPEWIANPAATDASGDPEWIANPAATDASYTVKGVVKGDTDAATSGLTIASGVISVNSGTTANKIVKLDASAKLPAVDGSQLTNLPVPTGANYAVNADETLSTYDTYSPIFAVTTANGWTATNMASTSLGIGAKYATWTTNVTGSGFAGLTSGTLQGTSSSSGWATATGKIIRIKFRMKMTAPAASNFTGFALGNSTGLISASTDTTTGLKFINDAGTLYAQNSNGTVTRTDISSGITTTNWNLYEVVFNPGTDIKFYVNGTLKATHTTNLPSGITPVIYFGTSGTNTNTVEVANLVISHQL